MANGVKDCFEKMPCLSREQQGIIFGVVQAGLSPTAVARHVGCHLTTITRFMSRHRQTGNVEDRLRLWCLHVTRHWVQYHHIRVTSQWNRQRRTAIIQGPCRHISTKIVRHRLSTSEIGQSLCWTYSSIATSLPSSGSKTLAFVNYGNKCFFLTNQDSTSSKQTVDCLFGDYVMNITLTAALWRLAAVEEEVWRSVSALSTTTELVYMCFFYLWLQSSIKTKSFNNIQSTVIADRFSTGQCLSSRCSSLCELPYSKQFCLLALLHPE